MVKVGFIVEGTSDSIFVKSEKFRKYLLHRLSLEADEENVITARGKPNLKKNLKSFINHLDKAVQYIFIMVDQDDKEQQKRSRKYNPPDCPLSVIKEISNFADNSHYLKNNHIFVVMTREFEAWLLADDHLVYRYDGLPEQIINPSEIIQQQERTSSHVVIAKRIIDKFSLERAATNAPSAKRFLKKLELINQH